ncbi:hypothetical protein BZA05DRAFT_459823 [Tricharina praecox]|uniref:uncharacterized protein n=1 Tax=Tricharina praecox TaxID=43433 RepID=UPI002220C331|nr:uncharacterized protein BZA05DRAFT_459823 [Tricharina praecox]KAI5856816.1 hypothetical protein BZA05DRAFT_459823 [Tricharina praecox]
MDGSTTRDTGQLALSSAGDMLDQNSSSGKKIQTPLDRMQWIQKFSEIDQTLKSTGPPTMSNAVRINEMFGILRGMCEGEHVIESLVPFEEEYLRLHEAFKARARARAHSRTISSSTIGEQVISHLLLEKLDDSLASLSVEDTPPKIEDTPPKIEDTPPKIQDTPPKIDETRAGAEAALTAKAKRRLPPSGLPRMIQPIGQQTHLLYKKNLDLLDEENQFRASSPAITVTGPRSRDQNASRVITPFSSRIPRYGPSPASGSSLAPTAHVETSDQHLKPTNPASATNITPPLEPETKSSPLLTPRVPSPFRTGPGKTTHKPRVISSTAPRQNRTAMLRAQNVKAEHTDISLARRKGKIESPAVKKAKEGANTNLGPQTARKKKTGFEDDDPFLDAPGQRSPIPPRFAEALAAQNGVPAVNDPKTGEPKPLVPELPQSLSKISIASSLISTPGKYPIGFNIDEENAHLFQRSMTGDTNKTVGTMSTTDSFAIAQTAQMLEGVQREGGALPDGISGDRLVKLGKRPSKPRPTSFSGSPSKPTAFQHRRSTSADSKSSKLGRPDPHKRGSLLPVKEIVDTSVKSGKKPVVAARPTTAEMSFIRKEQAALTNIQLQQKSNIQNWTGTLDQATETQMKSSKGGPIAVPNDASARPSDRDQQRLQKPVGFESKLKRTSLPRGTASSAAKKTSNTSTSVNPTKGSIRQRPTNGVTPEITNKGTGHVRVGVRVNRRSSNTPAGKARASPGSRRPTNMPIAKPPVLGNKSINIKSPVQQTPTTLKRDANVTGRGLPPGFSGPSRKENQGAQGKLSTAVPSITPRLGQKSSTPKLSPDNTFLRNSPGSSIPRRSPQPLADISGIGASKNPRVNTTTSANRKWLGLKKVPKLGPTTPCTPYEKIPAFYTATDKENVDPLKHQIPASAEQGTKSKKRLGVINWFRDNRASRQSGDNRNSTQSRLSGKSFPKFGKFCATGSASGRKSPEHGVPDASNPEFNITQEQVDTLKNRLSANYLSPQNTVGGQYFSKNVPTIDESPTRDEKEGNPIKVCIELITSASVEKNPVVKEHLFMLSQVMVTAVTMSRDAQCASQKAKVASDEAQLATAKVFVKLHSVVEMLQDWKKTGHVPPTTI